MKLINQSSLTKNTAMISSYEITIVLGSWSGDIFFWILLELLCVQGAAIKKLDCNFWINLCWHNCEIFHKFFLIFYDNLVDMGLPNLCTNRELKYVTRFRKKTPRSVT